MGSLGRFWVCRDSLLPECDLLVSVCGARGGSEVVIYTTSDPVYSKYRMSLAVSIVLPASGLDCTRDKKPQ